MYYLCINVQLLYVAGSTQAHDTTEVDSGTQFLSSLSVYASESEFKDKEDAEMTKKQLLTDLASRIFVEVVSRSRK